MLKTLSLFTLFSFVALANPYDDQLQGKTLRCTGKAQYLPTEFSFKLKVGGYGYEGATLDQKEVVFSWSQTECEDLTRLRASQKDVKAFISGESESFSALLEHSEPDLELKLQVRCH